MDAGRNSASPSNQAPPANGKTAAEAHPLLPAPPSAPTLRRTFRHRDPLLALPRRTSLTNFPLSDPKGLCHNIAQCPSQRTSAQTRRRAANPARLARAPSAAATSRIRLAPGAPGVASRVIIRLAAAALGALSPSLTPQQSPRRPTSPSTTCWTTSGRGTCALRTRFRSRTLERLRPRSPRRRHRRMAQKRHIPQGLLICAA